MKIFYIFIISLLLSTSLCGHEPLWTRVNDNLKHNKSSSYGLALLENSLLLNWGKVSVSCSYNTLIAYDLDGVEQWQLQFDYGMVGGPFNLVITKGDTIFAAGSDYTDDTNYSYLVLIALDKHGNILFQTSYQNGGMGHYDYVPGSLDVSKQGYIVVSMLDRNVVYMANDQGEVIWSEEYEGTPVSHVQFLNEHSFIIDHKFIADMQGAITDTLPFTGQLIVTDQLIYNLTSDELIAMDLNFQNPETIYSTEDMVLHELKIFEDKLWIISISEDQATLISLEDNELAGQWTFTLHAGPPDFVVSGDKVFFSGTSPSQQIATYAYSLVDTIDEYPWPDITIVDFNIFNFDYDHYWSEYGSYFYFDVEVTVRNNGDHPVSTFAVFSELDGFVNCLANYLYGVETGLNLMPQQEITVHYSRLDAFQAASSNNTFCFEVLAPNSMIELDISANKFCKSFDVANIEILQNENWMQIFPNPASDRITIKLAEEGINTLHLIDLRGRVLLQETLSGQNNTLNVSSLGPGVYFIRIQSNKGSVTKKLIKN
jgi:hypothetical protein